MSGTPNRESTSTSSIGNLVLELRKRALTAYRKKLHDKDLEEKAKTFHGTAFNEGLVVAAGEFVGESDIATNDPDTTQTLTQHDESLIAPPENIEPNQENMQRKFFDILVFFHQQRNLFQISELWYAFLITFVSV